MRLITTSPLRLGRHKPQLYLAPSHNECNAMSHLYNIYRLSPNNFTPNAPPETPLLPADWGAEGAADGPADPVPTPDAVVAGLPMSMLLSRDAAGRRGSVAERMGLPPRRRERSCG